MFCVGALLENDFLCVDAPIEKRDNGANFWINIYSGGVEVGVEENLFLFLVYIYILFSVDAPINTRGNGF